MNETVLPHPGPLARDAAGARVDLASNPPGADAARVASAASAASAVSWAAILAGAAAAAALSLILLVLGVGLGFSSVSPWAGQGASAASIGIATAVWICFTQLAAAAMGGYLAGRLRTRWLGLHGDEVYFRDTAHGFLAWAIATLVTAALLTSTIATLVGTGVQAGARVASGAASDAASGAASGVLHAAANAAAGPQSGDSTHAYFVDALWRPSGSATPALAAGPAASAAAGSIGAPGTSTPLANAPGPSISDEHASAQAAHVFANALAQGALPAEDTRYLGQLVARRTGLAQVDAEKRVSDVFARLQASVNNTQTRARQAAELARKTSAHSALWLFVSLLVGAFVASWAATYGGRQRDLF